MGASRYSPLRLTRLALHVLAGFWPQPIQWAGVLIGALCGTLALVVGIWATVVWVLRGDFPGMLYLGGLVLGVLAVQGFILALVGEYLGRIQRDVEGRPLYTIDSKPFAGYVKSHYEPFGEHKFRSYWFEIWAYYEAKRGAVRSKSPASWPISPEA